MLWQENIALFNPRTECGDLLFLYNICHLFIIYTKLDFCHLKEKTDFGTESSPPGKSPRKR